MLGIKSNRFNAYTLQNTTTGQCFWWVTQMITHLPVRVVIEMIRQHEVALLPVLVATSATSKLAECPLLDDLRLDNGLHF